MIKFKIKTENENGNKATVVIEPLEQGYGHTLGNSLRRCLLTSLQGSAITTVKIDNVAHQFSTIPGVTEDVIQIILNLKQVRIKTYGEKTIKVKLEKSGIGPVKASDIDTLGQGEVINGDQEILTISDAKAKVSMELTVETGMGYLPSEERKSAEIGVMSIDAIFSPILAANYSVEQTRVGRRTDFDKLNLDITTDGSISAVDAVVEAAKILDGYYKQIFEPSEEEEVEEVSTTLKVSDDVLKASVEELDLPVRITNALKAIEIDTIGKLTTTDPSLLMKAKNLGAKSLTLISEKLSERGLSLGEA